MLIRKTYFLIILILVSSSLVYATKKCPVCGTTYPDNYNFCPKHENLVKLMPVEIVSPKPQAKITADILVEDDSIIIRSKPANAKVYFDGEYYGEPEVIIRNVSVGVHTIRIQAYGYPVFSKTIVVERKIRPNIIVEGDSITITATPENVEVYLNEEFAAITPTILRKIPNGRYTIRLSHNDFPDYVKTIEISFTGDELYNKAYLDFTKGQYDDAIRGLRSYLERFPNTDLSDNAQYWIGECYWYQKKYGIAIEEFNKVISKYPQSNRMSASLYKIGLCYKELKNNELSRNYLNRVITSFPNSPEANLAREKLKEIKKSLKPDIQIEVNKITIRNIPGEIDVYLDDRYIGETKDVTPFVIKKVSPGSHTIKLYPSYENSDYDTYIENIFITSRPHLPNPFLKGLEGAMLSAVVPGWGQGKFKHKAECCGCGLIRTSAYGFYIAGLCCLIDVLAKPKNFLTPEDEKNYNTTIKIELYTTMGFYELNILEGYLTGRKSAQEVVKQYGFSK